MSPEDMDERIALVCHGREYDLPDSEHYPLYQMWLASVDRWGVESPPAMGCLLDLARAAWGDSTIHVTHEGPEVVEVWNGADAALVADRANPSGPLTFCASASGPMTVYWGTEREALVATLESAP